MVKKKTEFVTITSALPYVNVVKHLGNVIGSLLPADVFHRFMDLFGVPNIYICGTDEHGAQTEIAALEAGMTPAVFSDKYYAIQKEIYEKWAMDFTFFGRTSSKTHHELTQKMFKAIHSNGFVVQQELVLPFCKHCSMFLADRYIEGDCPKCNATGARGDQCEKCGKLLEPTELLNPVCKICGKNEIVFRKEKHLFLDLSKLQESLKKWIMKQKHWPQGTRNFALAWIEEGLKPRCITRNLKWGIKVPLRGYSQLVFYVWFDAPIGYVSMTKDGARLNGSKKKIGDWKRWWTGNSKIYHFLGKDNIPFHTVFWPGVLMAAKSKKFNFTLPYLVQGYEYLNWEGQKFSTSRGVGLFSDEALDLFPADYWRYYLMSILPEKKDSNFEWKDFQNKINNELIANYGNLFYRVTSFVEKHFGKLPRGVKIGKPEQDLIDAVNLHVEKIRKNVDSADLREALHDVMSLSDEINRYFQMKEPWFSVRDKRTRHDAATAIFYAANALAVVSLLLKPFIPRTAEHALKALNIDEKKIDINKIDLVKKPILKSGHAVRSLILFQKVEDSEIEKVIITSQQSNRI